MQLDRSKRYRASIENKSSIDREVSRRYRQQKISIDQRRYRASIEEIETPKNLAQWIGLFVERYREQT